MYADPLSDIDSGKMLAVSSDEDSGSNIRVSWLLHSKICCNDSFNSSIQFLYK